MKLENYILILSKILWNLKMQISHVNKEQNPLMIDVSKKQITSREAIAIGTISMSKEAYSALINNDNKKGSVINTAIVAAIMGAKKTSDLIPMCHNISLNKVDCEIIRDSQNHSISMKVIIKCDGKTGVEMEALSGVSIGLLTIYDMLKSIDKKMIINNIMLLNKSGGKSGDFLSKTSN